MATWGVLVLCLVVFNSFYFSNAVKLPSNTKQSDKEEGLYVSEKREQGTLLINYWIKIYEYKITWFHKLLSEEQSDKDIVHILDKYALDNFVCHWGFECL